MLPLEKVILALVFYLGVLLWSRLLEPAARQVWRLKWVLIGLFVVDYFLVSPELAVIITLRLSILACAFAMFFSTTTADELRLAMEWMRMPYPYAFSLSLAFQSVNLLDEEWRAIMEAQRSRGAWTPLTSWRELGQQLRDLVALGVPAIVLTTKRAWAATEAAYARGFDSPRRRPYRSLRFASIDWGIALAVLAFSSILVTWRQPS
jgi:energy-coupling factor transport system permease protein